MRGFSIIPTILSGEPRFPPLMTEVKSNGHHKCRRYTDDNVPPQVGRLIIAQLLHIHSKQALHISVLASTAYTVKRVNGKKKAAKRERYSILRPDAIEISTF